MENLMPISVSNYVLEAMGLQPRSPGHSLAAAFHSLHVYEIRGVTLEAPSLEPISGMVAGLAYTLSVGSSINAVCRRLVQDDYAESEEAWQVEHKCAPPYLIIHLGPTTEQESTGSHAKDEGRAITTYDSFPAARAELKAIEDKVLPPLLSAFACSFSSHPQDVHFVPTDRIVFGITPDNRTIHDFRLSASAFMHTSSKLEPSQIEERLAAGVHIASAINPKVARFFQLALDEDDPLKKFLYFFLAIEIETHASFAKIDHTKNISMLIAAPDRATVSTQDFFDGQRQRWTNLRDRFVWCVLCLWTHLCDADVEEFKRLKRIRDDIAHGSIATPPYSALAGAEKLAAKLQIPPA
jgi:hypothetical protein